MSRRNTRQGKAKRRAERERRQRSTPSGQGPQAPEVQAVGPKASGIQAFLAVPRPDGPGPLNPDKRGSGGRSAADGGLVTVEEPDEITAEEPDEADLDTSADPGDFGGLDADDADLQATLTVLAVLADDIGEDSEVADDLAGDTGDLIGDADDLIEDTDVLAGDADDVASDAASWPATLASWKYRADQKTSGHLRQASRPPRRAARTRRSWSSVMMTKTCRPRGSRSRARPRTRSRTI